MTATLTPQQTEARRRIEETEAKIEHACDWLRAVAIQRLQRQATGRILIELHTDEGYCDKLRTHEEENFGDGDLIEVKKNT